MTKTYIDLRLILPSCIFKQLVSYMKGLPLEFTIFSKLQNKSIKVLDTIWLFVSYHFLLSIRFNKQKRGLSLLYLRKKFKITFSSIFLSLLTENITRCLIPGVKTRCLKPFSKLFNGVVLEKMVKKNPIPLVLPTIIWKFDFIEVLIRPR